MRAAITFGMTPLVTDAIVLHAFNYLETSRILRLLTRDAGVQTVLARGARNSRKRFGSALDLFAQGSVQLQLKPGRDLHTLAAFDVGHPRPGLSESLPRFVAAAALAECVLRVVHDEPAPNVYEGVVLGLDAITQSAPDDALSAGLGSALDAGVRGRVCARRGCVCELPERPVRRWGRHVQPRHGRCAVQSLLRDCTRWAPVAGSRARRASAVARRRDGGVAQRG